MYVEYWSREEIEEYREDPNLLISKVNEMRYRVLSDLLRQLIKRLVSLVRKNWPGNPNTTNPQS